MAQLHPRLAESASNWAESLHSLAEFMSKSAESLLHKSQTNRKANSFRINGCFSDKKKSPLKGRLNATRIQMALEDNKDYVAYRTSYVFHSIHLQLIRYVENSVDD